MKIYTKTGDKGETGLIGGQRVSKADLRIAAYGAVDEANSCVGAAASLLRAKGDLLSDILTVLAKVQNDLFVVGSDLADPSFPQSSPHVPRVSADMTLALESAIDRFESQLEPITFFILPGGTPEASSLHQCRSVARRAETATVSLSLSQDINPEVIKYLNRLSDLMFVSARLANRKQGVADVRWLK